MIERHNEHEVYGKVEWCHSPIQLVSSTILLPLFEPLFGHDHISFLFSI